MNRAERIVMVAVLGAIILTGGILALFGDEASAPTAEPSTAINEALDTSDSIIRDLQYAQEDQRQILDIYLPEREDPAPLLIWVHGGAWVTGDKLDVPILEFVDEGYAVAALNYRYATSHPFPAQVEDVLSAVRYLRQNADLHNFDSEDVALIGHSAGAQIAAVAALSANSGEYGSGEVRAVVSVNGPYDVSTLEEQLTQLDIVVPESFAEIDETTVEEILLGCIEERCPERFVDLNPASYADTDDPAVFLQHGRADTVVPYLQSTELAESFRRINIDVGLHIIEGAGHQFQITQPMRDFLAGELQ